MPLNLENGFCRFFLPITCLLLALSPSAGAVCEKARWLAPGERLELAPGDSVEWLRVEAFERGLLHVEISAPPQIDGRPIVGFWGFDCAARAAALPEPSPIIDRSPEHVTLQVGAFDTAYFRVAWPASGGAALQVRAALVPLGPATKGGEDEEVIELDGLQAPPQGLCPRTDDHAASLLCATRTGSRRKLAGRLEQPDDVDTFQLRIGAESDPQALWRLRLDSGEGLRLELFEAGGLPLEGDLRRGTALTAGVYFLRISSHDGTAGDYTLALELEAW